MSRGSKEIDRLFRRLNHLIDKAKKLREDIQRSWEGEFPKDFIIINVQKLLSEIEFFQEKYNIEKKLKINTKEILNTINEKFQIKTKKVTIRKEPGFWDRVFYSLKEEDSKPKAETYTSTKTYGKFIENPQEDIIQIYDELMKIYHNCLKIYSPSELDIAELNLGKFLKLRFLKSWKSVAFLVFIAMLYTVGIAFLAGWISTLF